MEAKKTVTKVEPTVTPDMQKAIDLAVENAMKGLSPTIGVSDKYAEVQEQTLQTLKDIAERSVPADSRAALEQQAKDFESPYIPTDDKVAVLTVSTSDLQRMDGWPGQINEPLPGQFTKQGLQKRLILPLEIVYDPSVDSRYSLAIIDREEYEKIVIQRRGISGIPNATMVASMGARAGEE